MATIESGTVPSFFKPRAELPLRSPFADRTVSIVVDTVVFNVVFEIVVDVVVVKNVLPTLVGVSASPRW